MKNRHMTTFVHNYLKENVLKDDVMVDATMGNGHDTAFLCNLSKFVYAFDIQEQALKNTSERLQKDRFYNYQLIKDSFLNISNYITEFKGVVFNLGFLPGSEKTITTTKEITLKTLEKLINIMPKNSFIIITCYQNHPGGLEESQAVLDFSKTLNEAFKVLKYEVINISKYLPPFVVLIEKKD